MQLSLLRHAKTRPGSATLADIDRPLEDAGRAALRLMEPVLAETPPDLVLCSAALRTRQTWEQIEPALATAGGRIVSHIEEALYLADAESLLARLRRVPDAAGHVLLIGHNPGIHDLALALLAPEARGVLSTGFPTAALARLSVARWPDLRPARAGLLLWVTPRDLERGAGP